MGVKGLQTYVESKPAIFRMVDIAEMAADYWRSHPDASGKPVIVVDGNNFLHQGLGQNFCENQLDWICGGQWDEYRKALGDFIDSFEKIGVKLAFVFDGLIKMDKLDAWLAKRYRNLSDIKEIFAQIKDSLPVAPNIYTVAPILSYTLRAALKYVFNKAVYCTVDGDCNQSLASFAAKHQCMAILAQDTDYIIYPTTVPYISMLHLDLKTMHSKMYSREALCQELGLKEWMLPLFACMVGTDYVTRESLAGFHKRISMKKFIKGLPRIHTIVRCVAEFIKKNVAISILSDPKRLEEVYKLMGFGHRSETSFDKFKAAVELYSLDFTKIDGFIYPGTKHDDDDVKNVFEVVQRKIENGELLPTVLHVIYSGRDMFSHSLEDTNADKKLTPCFTVYRPIRQRMYGLIFELKKNYFTHRMEIPHTGCLMPMENTVEEWWINPSLNAKKNNDAVAPITVNLPEGVSNATVLHDIIMENDEDLIEKKWAVFRACLELTTSDSKFQSLSPQHKIICAILNYLIQQENVLLKVWEFEAFIIQAVHPKFEDTDNHMQLQLCPYNSRAVHLATLFLRGADIIFDLLWLCGNPIEMKHLMPWQFFNGKFFHHIYKEMHMSEDHKVELSGEHLAKFDQIKAAILEGIDEKKCFH